MAVIPKYVSNTQKDFKIGVDNYSEDKLSLQIIGNVGIGTTSYEDPVSVANTAKLAVGVATAHIVYAQIFSGTSGTGIQTNGTATTRGTNIAIGNTFTGNTFNNADYNYRNISIGDCAGCCLNNGAKNVLIGDRAGSKITNGFKNVVIGETAMGGGSGNAGENFVVGDSAGYNLTSGSHNIIFGDQSGGFTSTGGCNIFIGRRSGMGNQTGNCNVVLGNFAGYINGNGSDNILIGTCVQGVCCNPSKTLTIGHYNHQWIHGDSNYNIGIGITNPSIAVVGAGSTQKLAAGIVTAYNLFAEGVNISGVSTFTGIIDGNGGANIVGGSTIDQLNVTGVSTFAGITTNTGTLFANQLNVAGVSTFSDDVNLVGTGKSFTSAGKLFINNAATFYGNGLAPIAWGHTDTLAALTFDIGLNAVIRTLDNNDLIFQTSGTNTRMTLGSTGGVDVNTSLNVAGISTFNNTVDINSTLDVDGDTQLDDLNVAGVATFSSGIDANGTLDVDGDTQLDDLTVAGFATFTSNASFAGNVSIAGTLTYEDVTNIDAIGIITAGNGLRVTQGGINVTTGISTFGDNIKLPNDKKIQLGDDIDLQIYHFSATNNNFISAANNADLTLSAREVELMNQNHSSYYFKGAETGSIVYHNNAQRLATSGVGVTVYNQLDTTDLNVAGVSTFTGLIDANNRLDVVGGANVDQLNVSGVSTFAGITTVTGSDLFAQRLNVAGVSTFHSKIKAFGRIDVGDVGTTGQVRISNGTGYVFQIASVGGNLTLRSSNGGVKADDNIGRNLFFGSPGGAFSIYHSGSNKLQTTSTGVNVNGNVVSDGLVVDGHSELDNVNVAGVSTFAGNINANGNIVGDDSTNISGINSVTATAFFGDGSGLENTGATLSAASGSQRLVLTSLTSGTMTSAATDADLAFNATSNLLSAGKLNVVGLTTISNLKVDSGIVTAASGIATYNGDLVIGTPSAGFKSGAFTINTTDKTKDSINELNFILGKLVPDPPDTINGVSFTLSGLGNGRLCAGFTPVNNTGGSHAVAAGRQYSRNTDSTVTSNTLTEFGPGDSETVTGFVNAVGVGTTTLTVGVNNGTFDKLVISNNEDAANSSRNPGITSQFYEIYDARLLNAPSPDGFNKAFISQGISTTTSAFWYEDPSTVSAPVISFSPVTYPASPTLSYSSGIPHYTQASANAFTYALGVENASGDMYTQNTFVSSDGQTSGFQNPGNKSYTNFTGGTNPPARNYGVGAAVTTQVSQQPRDLHLTATSNVFTSFDASTPYGSHNNQRVGFTTDVNIMGTTARTNKIDEDNILISSLGTGSGNATRVNAGSTGDNPSPVFTAWGGGSAGSIATYEATVRGAVLRHDQEDYSDGTYLPVGPDYSAGRSGTQYFQIELIRSNVSEFSISYTGSVAGCFICMPQNSAWTTSLSGVNGWADMFQAYKGSGIPTSAEPGCSSGGLMDNNGGTFTCVFGTESSSNDTGNRILIRWKLTSGQSITAMSFTST